MILLSCPLILCWLYKLDPLERVFLRTFWVLMYRKPSGVTTGLTRFTAMCLAQPVCTHMMPVGLFSTLEEKLIFQNQNKIRRGNWVKEFPQNFWQIWQSLLSNLCLLAANSWASWQLTETSVQKLTAGFVSCFVCLLVLGLEFAQSQRAMENREKWRELVVKSSVVPQLPPRLRDRWRWRRKARLPHRSYSGVTTAEKSCFVKTVFFFHIDCYRTWLC